MEQRLTAPRLLWNSVYVERRKKTIVLTVRPPPMSVVSVSCFGVQRLARFSLNVGAHYSINPSLDSSALLLRLRLKSCRLEFQMKKIVEILLNFLCSASLQQQLRPSLKTFSSVPSGSNTTTTRMMKTGEQGVLLAAMGRSRPFNSFVSLLKPTGCI